jgi:hypothetical protein
MTPVELVLSKLPDAKRSGHGWQSPCPAHDDRQPSLSIGEGDDGRALLHCHAGCTTEAIVQTIGLKMSDLMPLDKGGEKGDKRRIDPSKRVGEAKPLRKPRASWATPEEAIASLRKNLGQETAKWRYDNPQGQAKGYVIRWDTPQGKTIRPIHRTDAGRWSIGGMTAPRPLYGLPDLLRAPEGSRIYICEGEKAADLVRAAGLLATTSAHGCKSADQTDWSPLAGHEVVHLPDADDAGEGYAESVLQQLERLDQPPKACVVRLPGLELGSGDDVVEYAANCQGDLEKVAADLEAFAESALSEILPNDKTTKLTKPLLESSQPFPVDALPGPLAGFVRTGSAAFGCDPSMLALPVLTACASAIGNTRRIHVKDGWDESAIIWSVIVAESGSMKSPAFRLAVRPLQEIQNEAFKSYFEELEEFHAESKRYEAELSAWKKKPDGDPPELPDEPVPPRCLVGDTTVEALAPILAPNPRGVLLARDEIAGWIGSFGRYSGKAGADVSHWLSMFSGDSIIVDRKTGPDKIIQVDHAAVWVCGGIQPGIFKRELGQQHRENGLASRLLLAMPPRRPKRWTDEGVPPAAEAEYALLIEKLRELAPNPNTEQFEPITLNFSAAAKKVFVAFYDAHNLELTQLSGDLAAVWSKMEAYAARLALVHHLVREANGEQVGPTVDKESMLAGVILAKWFCHEAKRVYEVLDEDEEQCEIRQKIELIKGLGGVVSVRDWQRQHGFRTSADARADLSLLEETGLGEIMDKRSGGKGGRPSKVFILHHTESPKPATSGAYQEEQGQPEQVVLDEDEWEEL